MAFARNLTPIIIIEEVHVKSFKCQKKKPMKLLINL